MAGTSKGSKGNGGRRKGAGRKKGEAGNKGRAGKSPEQFMNALVPAGPRVDHDRKPEAEPIDAEPVDFGTPIEPIDPVQFCLAVINGNKFILQSCGVSDGAIEMIKADVGIKIEAARIAAPFTNKKKPVDVDHKHTHSWGAAITEAENRTRTMRMDVGQGQEHDDVTPETTH